MNKTVGYAPSLYMHFENLVGWGSPLYHVRACIEAISDGSGDPLTDRIRDGLDNASRHLFASTNRKPIPDMLEQARHDGDHGDSNISWPLYRLIRNMALNEKAELPETAPDLWGFLATLPRPYADAVVTNWLSLMINDMAAYAADSFQRADRADLFRRDALNLLKFGLPTVLKVIQIAGQNDGQRFLATTLTTGIDKAIFHSDQDLGAMPPKLPTLLGGDLFAPAIMLNVAHSFRDRDAKTAALSRIAEYWTASHAAGGISADTQSRINARLEEDLMADPSRLASRPT